MLRYKTQTRPGFVAL